MWQQKKSLFTIVLAANLAVVVLLLGIYGLVSYRQMHTSLTSALVKTAQTKLHFLSRSLPPLIDAYAVNDYMNIIKDTAISGDYEVIVVEDNNMAELTEEKRHISGYALNEAGSVVEYNPAVHQSKLDNCEQPISVDLVNSNGRKVGKAALCYSVRDLRKNLREILIETAVLTLVFCIVLLLLKFFLLRELVHQPVEKLIDEIKNTDEAGLPKRPLGFSTIRELSFLADTINAMVKEVRSTRRDFEQKAQSLVDQRTKELVESESKNRALVNNIGDGVVVIDQNSVIESFNPAAKKIFGYGEQEIKGKKVEKLMPKAERKKHSHFVRNSMLYESRIINKDREVMGVRKNGTTFPMELNVTRMSQNGKTRFVGVMRDISERVETEKKLKEAKQQAEDANRAKSVFLSSMSHELRTPLNAIMGFSELMLYSTKDKLSDAQVQKVESIHKGGQHLLELINDVLDLSKVEAGNMALSIERTACDDIVDESLSLVESMAKKHTIKIENRIDDNERVYLWADRLRVKQVVINLLTNAIKYNRPEGQVWVEGENRPGNMYRITITDNGRGIADDKKDELFVPFNRLGAESSDIEGSGIGLALGKKLAEEMGGTIGFTSQEGAGASFWIDLPVYKSTDEDTTLPQSSVDIKERLLLSNQDIKILYIEDNKGNIELMRDIADEFDHVSLIYLQRAEQCLITAQKEKPDIVVMDLHLPGMNGFEALKQLKENEQTKDIPVIALSADAQKETIKKVKKSGFDAYLSKPLNLKKFLDVLNKLT